MLNLVSPRQEPIRRSLSNNKRKSAASEGTMPYRRKTFSKFIIEHQRRPAGSQPELTSLLNEIQTSCKLIALAAARGQDEQV